ncbi:MAG: LCP family protein, partial [Dehalococcoidia bacterium]|nr:LCP family protein [Dehalococcoidia bacterium]
PALFPGKTLSSLLPVLDDLPSPIIKPSGSESSFNKRINLLIIGVDKRPGYQELDAYLTDTIMIATVDPLSKESAVLSFPRDMLIDIHTSNGVYLDRINTSYGIGVQEGNSFKAGAEHLAFDIKENFGIEVDHWVVMDFEGVEKLIDALGGIDVDIPWDLSVPDWYYSNDDINPVWVAFPPGPTHLDGYHAVAFGRYRNDSDLYRVKRQQLVLQTALAKVFSQGLLNDPIGLWNAYNDTVKTDIPVGSMPGYGLLLKSTNGRLKTYSLGDEVNGVQTLYAATTPSGAAVLEWDRDNVRYWISQAFTPAKYAASVVEIQNGYGPDGEVRTLGLGRYLKYVQGLPTVEVGGDTTPQPTTTITLFDPAKRSLAEDIARWLEIPATAIRTAEKTTTTQPDVAIVIGADFRVPGGEEP